jgi:hypothetical protein
MLGKLQYSGALLYNQQTRKQNPWVFAHQKGYGYGLCGLMGYGMKFPANQVGGQLLAMGYRGYGLSGVWVKRGSTVIQFSSANPEI